MSWRGPLRLALLAAALAIGTVVAGWWALPIVGAIWGWLNRGARWVGIQTGAAAAIAWGSLLVWTASTGPFSVLLEKITGVMGLSAPALYALTIGFAAVAAGAAAGLAATAGPRSATMPSRAG